MEDKNNLNEKKLRGSGGYSIAKISDEEQKMANLGGPELFLAGIGRLGKERFVKYYCNRCEKEYEDSPNIDYENPNEDLGENITLTEKGEYKCRFCNYIIAQYRKFEEKKVNYNEKSEDNVQSEQDNVQSEQNGIKEEKQIEITKEPTFNDDGISAKFDMEYTPINSIIGMRVYNSNANLIGKISEIGLRKNKKQLQFSLKIKDMKEIINEISWSEISQIGDIIILKDNGNEKQSNSSSDSNNESYKICTKCNHKNDIDSQFCEECGIRIG